MSSYRFCRSDDVPLLVRAYNACYRVHFPDLPEMRIEDFKLLIRRLDIWTSSCMVALADGAPIGVLLSAKRDTESLIHCVGVVPPQQRREHGRHMLASLSQKLGILGPPRLVAEVPSSWVHARKFIASCGYRAERSLTDFEHLGTGGEGSPSPELVFPVTVDELLANDALDDARVCCWQRANRTVVARKAELGGFAVASDRRIEAYLLYHEPAGGTGREIVGFHCADSDRAGVWLAMLFRHACAGRRGAVRIERVDEGEIDFGLLQSWGFRPVDETVLYATEADAPTQATPGRDRT